MVIPILLTALALVFLILSSFATFQKEDLKKLSFVLTIIFVALMAIAWSAYTVGMPKENLKAGEIYQPIKDFGDGYYLLRENCKKKIFKLEKPLPQDVSSAWKFYLKDGKFYIITPDKPSSGIK